MTTTNKGDQDKEVSNAYSRGYSAGRSSAYRGPVTFAEMQSRGFGQDVWLGLIDIMTFNIEKQLRETTLARKLLAHEQMTPDELTEAAKAILEPHIQEVIRRHFVEGTQPTPEADDAGPEKAL